MKRATLLGVGVAVGGMGVGVSSATGVGVLAGALVGAAAAAMGVLVGVAVGAGAAPPQALRSSEVSARSERVWVRRRSIGINERWLDVFGW